jgi:hypothetical protein
MIEDVSFRSHAWITRFDNQLKARRDRLSRVLALMPATKAQEARRQAWVQAARNSVEDRHQWAGAYKEHLGALEHILKRTEEMKAVSGSTAGSPGIRGNMGDF